VSFIMSRIQMLRSHGVEPIMVFDGGRLPIKGEEEATRRRCVVCSCSTSSSSSSSNAGMQQFAGASCDHCPNTFRVMQGAC
jgi:hypothetical protein